MPGQVPQLMGRVFLWQVLHSSDEEGEEGEGKGEEERGEGKGGEGKGGGGGGLLAL